MTIIQTLQLYVLTLIFGPTPCDANLSNSQSTPENRIDLCKNAEVEQDFSFVMLKIKMEKYTSINAQNNHNQLQKDDLFNSKGANRKLNALIKKNE